MTESNQLLISELPTTPIVQHTQQQKLFVPSPPQHPSHQTNVNENIQTCETQTQTQTDFVIDLDNEINNSLTSGDMKGISNYAVFDELGNRHCMGELWSEFRTIFVFVRSLLCFTTKEYVEDLALIPRDSLKNGQIRLVVITCAHWKHLKSFRQLTRFPYLLFSDMDSSIYNKLGFNKTKDLGQPGDSCHVKSGNFGGILFHSMRRALSTSTLGDYQGAIDQQGGSLIVGPGANLHFCHVDKHGRDHYPINSLLNKVGLQGVNFPNQTQDNKQF